MSPPRKKVGLLATGVWASIKERGFRATWSAKFWAIRNPRRAPLVAPRLAILLPLPWNGNC